MRGFAKPKRNGGRHCCQPPLRRAKDLPVFTVQVPGDPFQKSWLTSSGVASHLTTPSEEETDHLLDRASRRLARLSTIGAWQSQSHPMFRGPSWDDHCRRLALSFRPKASEPRRANRKIISSGASSRLAPRNPEELLIACRRRSVLPSPSASFLPLPAFRGGGDFRPDHQVTMHLASESGKQKMRVKTCG